MNDKYVLEKLQNKISAKMTSDCNFKLKIF